MNLKHEKTTDSKFEKCKFWKREHWNLEIEDLEIRKLEIINFKNESLGYTVFSNFCEDWDQEIMQIG